MPGYVLLEQNKLSPPLPPGKGVPANKTRIAIGDFLRSLEDETFPYDENSSLLVTGIEEVLLASRPDMDDWAKEIRKRLQKVAAPFTNRRCGEVQIVFRQPLKRGDKLMVDHVTEPIPIYLIFGTPVPETISNQVVYRTGTFNLSGSGY